jgi:hypothetical protein
MTVEQVLTLVEKGFTRDDIMKLTGDGSTSSHVPEADSGAAGADPGPVSSRPDQAAKPVNAGPAENAKDDPEPKEPAAAAAEPTETEKRLDSIEQSISKLIKSIQANNVKSDSFGEQGGSLEEQTDRIMASIIRPEHINKGKE